MLLTSEELLPRLGEHLDASVRVDIASAWATQGPALDAMQNAFKRAKRVRRPFDVRAIIGLGHQVTTRDALKALRDIGELRLVKGDRFLFHPKVYIFHHKEEGRSAAWVGSANFTGKGIGHAEERVNEEIVFETQCVREIVDWFERRWEEIGCLDEKLLSDYFKNYKPRRKVWLDERPEPSSLSEIIEPDSEPDSLSEITFTSHGEGSRGYCGDCRFVWSSGSEETLRYETRQEALEIVLRKLSRNFQNEQLLESIERDGYKIGINPLLAANQGRIYQKPSPRSNKPKPLAAIPAGEVRGRVWRAGTAVVEGDASYGQASPSHDRVMSTLRLPLYPPEDLARCTPGHGEAAYEVSWMMISDRYPKARAR